MTTALERLLLVHGAAPWPESVERGREYGQIEPVMADADIFGTALGARDGVLSSGHRGLLVSTAARLNASIKQFPTDARPYFERLVEIARLATEVDAR